MLDFRIWGEIVQRSLILNSHLSQKNPIPISVPWGPCRLALAPWPDPSSAKPGSHFAAPAHQPSPAQLCPRGFGGDTKGQELVPGSPEELSSTASLLKSPLPTQSLCPPRPVRRGVLGASPRHLPGGRARSYLRHPHPGAPRTRSRFFIPGPRTKRLLPEKNGSLSSSSSPGSFPDCGGGCARAAAAGPRAGSSAARPPESRAASSLCCPRPGGRGAPRHPRLAPQGVLGVRAPSGGAGESPGTHAAGGAGGVPGRGARVPGLSLPSGRLGRDPGRPRWEQGSVGTRRRGCPSGRAVPAPGPGTSGCLTWSAPRVRQSGWTRPASLVRLQSAGGSPRPCP